MLKGIINGKKFKVKHCRAYSSHPALNEVLKRFNPSIPYMPSVRDKENYLGKKIVEAFGGEVTHPSNAKASKSHKPGRIY